MQTDWKLLTLFYGTAEQRRAYLPLLRRWLGHHRALGHGGRIVIATLADEPSIPAELAAGCEILACRIEDYRRFLRPGMPFDIKGALMCEALRLIPGDFLLLDNDAFLQRDPAELPPPEGTLIGMARDIGAINAGWAPMLEAPFDMVAKRCAGVVWFSAATPQARTRLVSAYCRAWTELKDAGGPGVVPWTPQLTHLVEQYAWSLVAHRLKQPILRDRWNWPPHIAAFGASRLAIVNHEFGHGKWRAVGHTPPRNV